MSEARAAEKLEKLTASKTQTVRNQIEYDLALQLRSNQGCGLPV